MKLTNNLFLNRTTASAKALFFFMITICMLALTAGGCDSSTDSKEDEADLLKVKFINSVSSEYTITTLQVQAMGKSQESTQPTGEWSGNVLPSGTRLAPGESAIFNLGIPNLYWSRYRLGVDNGQGSEVMLHNQNGYPDADLPITHWGGDERTVEVTVIHHQESGLILVSGWSEFAGID
jgi:hypothetical protein